MYSNIHLCTTVLYYVKCREITLIIGGLLIIQMEFAIGNFCGFWILTPGPLFESQVCSQETDRICATAKSLQSYPTLCDPMDGSPPGSPVPGILQARTLEWVAISFSNA